MSEFQTLNNRNRNCDWIITVCLSGCSLFHRPLNSTDLLPTILQFNVSLSEYDSLQDKSDSQANQIKVLSKDLELSVQDSVKAKEKLALTESDLAEKSSRLGSVSSELSDCQAKIKGLEESRAAQEKLISKISAENRELVNEINLFSCSPVP